MPQLFVPIQFWARLMHAALACLDCPGGCLQRPDSHLKYGLIPFYGPIKQQWNRASAGRTGC